MEGHRQGRGEQLPEMVASCSRKSWGGCLNRTNRGKEAYKTPKSASIWWTLVSRLSHPWRMKCLLSLSRRLGLLSPRDVQFFLWARAWPLASPLQNLFAMNFTIIYYIILYSTVILHVSLMINSILESDRVSCLQFQIFKRLRQENHPVWTQPGLIQQILGQPGNIMDFCLKTKVVVAKVMV